MPAEAVVRAMSSKRALVAAAAAIAASGVLAACGGGSSADSATSASTTEATTPAGTPKDGGTLRVRIAADEGCLDPQQMRTRSQILLARQYVDSLTFQNEKGEIVPWLASKWTVNDDATAFTFTIRPGVTFSDGSPVTAKAVKQNLDGLVKMGAAASTAAPYLANYAGSSAAGDELTVRFSKPEAQFLQASSTPALGILSPATLKKSLGDRCAGELAGSGPFTIGDYVRNTSLTLDRRSGYGWAPEGFANTGEAHLERIQVRMVPDGSVGTGMLLSGQIDLMADVPPQDVTRILDGGKKLTDRPNPGMATPFFPNIKNAPLDELAVRQAINLALNREELVETTLSPVESAATAILSPTTPGYAPQPEYVRYDLEEAKRVLDEAGWVPGPDGIREKDGKPLNLRIMYFTPAQTPYLPFLQLAQQQLEQAGIGTRLQPVTITQLVANERSGNYDLEYLGLTRGDPDVLNSKFAGYDPKMDELLAALSAESDPAERDRVAQEAQDYAMQNAWTAPLHNFTYPTGYSDALQGLVFDDSNTPSLSEAWLDN